MSSYVQLVCFSLGDESFGVDIGDVREIVRVRGITPVPKTEDHVLGVVNLRGKLVTVVDLAAWLGFPSVEPTRSSRILVADLEGSLVGFLVDRATEVTKLAAELIDPPPPELASGPMAHCVEGVGRRDGGLIIVLNLKGVVPSEERVEIDS